MKSGMHKPPLAPKPKLAQRQPAAPSPSTPRKVVLPQQSPGPPRKMKPMLAPKPKLNSKASEATATGKTPQMVGLRNSQNGIQHDNKKPNWDYIIPICLCSQKNCRCLRDSHIDKTERDFKTLHKVKAEENGKTDHSKSEVTPALTANGHLPNPKLLRDTVPVLAKNLNQNLNTSSPPIKVGQLLLRAVSDEPNVDAITREEDSSEHKNQPVTSSKPNPVPVPRRHKNPLLACQEEDREEAPVQEGRKMQGLKMSSEGKGSASSSVSVTATRPAPTPRKKPYLAVPEKGPSSAGPAPSTLQSNVDEEDLGWDSNAYDTELSVDEEVASEGRRDHEPSTKDQTRFLSSSPDNRDGAAKLVLKKPQRNNSPMAWMKKTESPESLKSGADVTAGLPLPPTSRTHESSPTADKHRSRSFSGADLVRSEGRRSSFRKLLDLKLSAMMPPKLVTKSSPEVAKHLPGALGAERNFSSPLLGVEQSVDGEEQDGNYENICYYEEISDYENIYFGGSDASSATWRSLHNDDGIYEDPEAYLSRDTNTDYDRCDFREAVATASRQSGKAVIEERLLDRILYYLPQLYQLNRDLLQELHTRLDKWDEKEQVADIFLKVGPYLKMYSTYIRHFDKNAALLEEQCKKNPPFAAVVRQFEASPRCANLALKHYLLKPVQRIPQYQLLLRDYLKNLSKDSSDYKDTQDALAIVQEVATHANDIMKQGDNFQKLIEVQCSLSGHREIVQPGRTFVKEGVLNKLSRKVMQPRMFFLFNDSLLYTTPLQSGQYKVNNVLSLAGMKVSRPGREACRNEFVVESVERSFILSASSASERDEWLEAISAAIGDYTKKKITFICGKSADEARASDGDGASLGGKAPIWIPDPRATMCMICTCEFTLTWRRHHCRACGKVVCQSCSSNKRSLAYLKNQLARVCDQCDLLLGEHQSDDDPSLPKASSAFSRKHKRIPAALKEVRASAGNSSMSGYLQRSKGRKKQGKRLWFVIKDKVLYTYAASEDVAALESQPLLGFVLKVDPAQKWQFKLYHKNTLYYNFKADDVQTAQRWISTFRESAIL